ncbi:MAG TPA: hypothetical protein VD908_05030 [Cytophagales bacterium]|nr:hypothetical protein [Cytophagales bacterium]
MKNTDKNFEDEWRKAFDGAEEEPSAHLWQSLENKLAEKELTLYKKKYFYLRTAAAVLLFLFASSSLFYVYHYTQENILASNGDAVNLKSQQHEFEEKITTGNTEPSNNTPSEIREEHRLVKTNKPAAEPDPASVTSKAENSNSYAYKEENKSALSNTQQENTIPPLQKKTVLSSAPIETKEKNKAEAIDNKELFAADDKKSSSEDRTIMPKRAALASSKEGEKDGKSFSFVSAVKPISSKTQDLNNLELKTIYIARRPIIKEELYLASNSKKDKESGKRWYASYAYTPTYTNQNFVRASSKNIVMSNTQSFGSRKAEVDAINVDNSAQELEAISPQYSWNTGINGGYKITEKLVVEMGVNYAYTESKVQTNYFVKDNSTQNQYPAFNTVLKEYPAEEKTIGFFNSLYTDISSNNSGSVSIPTNQSDLRTARIYTQYVGVPITINYKLIDKKVNVFIGGGISTDFFLEYGSKENASDGFEQETVKSNETTTFKPVGLSFLINPQIEYEVNSKYSFYLRPVYKAALNSYTDTNKISNKPTSTGLGFGLKYNFN